VRDRVVIGSRGSRLALVQSNHVADLLRAAVPGLTVEIEIISTRGDQIIDRPLAEIGGKGLFTEELERALRAKTIDLAVHSLKDLPVQDPGGLVLGAIPKRATPNDALVAREATSLETLKQGARVGTSSLRRKAQLLLRRKDLEVVDLRGNVDTRIAKVLERGELDAAVLACAGLERIGRADVITQVLKPEVMLPAPGQGALGIQCRADDVDSQILLHRLDDADTRTEVTAERALLEGLGGGCQAPIGALGKMVSGRLRLSCGVFSLGGGPSIIVAVNPMPGAPRRNVAETVRNVLEALREGGADKIIAQYR
jgi:hydroxymethylbilane synthase